MPSGTAMDGRANTPDEGATEVISREIRAGHEREYDEWLRRMLTFKRQFPGYLGTTVIAPGGGESSLRYVVTRFRDKETLDSWRKSPGRARLIEEVREYSTPYFGAATGLETWFGLPGRPSFVPPPRWKMAIITLGAAIAISFTSRFLLDPYLSGWGLLLSTVFFTTVLVVFLLYLVLPGLTRLLRGWLYPAVS
jgi:uncharacterized protein